MKRLAGWLILLSAACAEEVVAPGMLTPVSQVIIGSHSTALVLGDTVQLVAHGISGAGDTLPGRQIIWSSSEPDHIIVGAGGAATALSPGDAVITATIEGKTGTVALSAIALSFASISAGHFHTCGVTVSGAAWCWGRNADGQLGVDSVLLDQSRAPRQVVGNLAFATVLAGEASSCGLLQSGVAWCWGRNSQGQLGDGTVIRRDAPVSVQGNITFSGISAPMGHTCGVLTSGGQRCWGDNDYGQLGDGSYADRLTAVAVVGGHDLTEISTSDWGFSCGLDTNGSAWCWGDDWTGSLGHDTVYFSTSPSAVAGGFSFQSVTARSTRGCGVTTSGSTYCWGTRRANYVGVTQYAPMLEPQVPLLASVSEGDNHTCGLTPGGQAWCWGDNEFGQLGNGGIGEEFVDYAPVQVAGGLIFTSLTSGEQHTCALDAAGAAWCWGANRNGYLGTGTTDSVVTTPAPVVGGLSFASLTAGGTHTCGLTNSGAGYCWGYNDFGQLGDGSPFYLMASPSPIAGNLSFSFLSAGSYHSCGIVSGAAHCWGANYTGELGDGTTVSTRAPVPVSGGLTFLSLAVGRSRTCGLDSAGVGYCWGDNHYGALGDGTELQRLSPTPVAGGLQFTEIVAGDQHVCAVTLQAAAYCWGNNRWATLGNGVRTDSPIPVPAAEGVSFMALRAGRYRTCALATSGDVYCWPESQGNPAAVLVPGGQHFAQLTVGPSHACGLLSTGEAYCWGSNTMGQLGNGEIRFDQPTPLPVSGGLRFSSITSGAEHTCGMTTAGVAYCWGRNQFGQLGVSGFEGAGGIPFPVIVRGQSEVP